MLYYQINSRVKNDFVRKSRKLYNELFVYALGLAVRQCSIYIFF